LAELVKGKLIGYPFRFYMIGILASLRRKTMAAPEYSLSRILATWFWKKALSKLMQRIHSLA